MKRKINLQFFVVALVAVLATLGSVSYTHLTLPTNSRV